MSALQQPGEYESEPVAGLPEALPEGEVLLWQGAPEWRGLARRVFHTRKVAVYFGLLLCWRVASLASGQVPAEQAAFSIGALLALALVALGILTLLAWLHARATLYTITNRRVVLRFGVALPMAINLPFRCIQSAGLRSYPDGTGDLPLCVSGAKQVGYVVLWPHARPWRFGSSAQPMLRSIPEVRAVAETLRQAVAAPVERTPVRIPAAPAADAAPVAAVS